MVSREIYDYLNRHRQYYSLDLNRYDLATVYGPVLEGLLNEAGLLDKTIPIRDKLYQLCRNKYFLEVGCRDGQFLHFLQLYGARVEGTTDFKYERGYELLLRKKPILLPAAEAWKARKIIGKSPNYLISSNLFTNTRWLSNEVPFPKILRSLYRLTSPRTRVVVVPNVDGESILSLAQLRTLARVRGVKTHPYVSTIPEEQNWNYAIRLRVRRRGRPKARSR